MSHWLTLITRRLVLLWAWSFGLTGALLAAEPAPLPDDLQLLAKNKIIASADYWQKNAVKGQRCDGAQVASLLIKSANTYSPAANLDQAIDILTRHKVIWNDYYNKNALPGKTCAGEYVATIIRLVAAHLADADFLAKFAAPPGVIPQPEPSAFASAGAPAGPDTFNYVVGTQTFSPTYQFTKKTKLVETAEAIRALGSTVIKFRLAHNYAGANGNVPAPNPAIRTLTELARDEASHHAVLDLPFAHYVLWVHSFTGCHDAGWRKGLGAEAKANEYKEMYDLVCYLLKTYTGTGKTFYLGHWEGDGWLRGTVAKENDVKVTPQAVQGMADWLNIRQQAVDAAKRDTPHKQVQVWHYTEVNHVWLAMQGRKALVNEVLPKTSVDLVSYSSYDTASDPAKLKAALSFIESKLPPKPGLTGRRVFIGEYGFPSNKCSPAEQDALSRQVMRAGLEWGCPFVLYWELFNNEVEPDGRQRGFWMIDDHGAKQPVYRTHEQFYRWAQSQVAESLKAKQRPPTYNEFRQAAVKFLDNLPAAKP